MSNHGCWENLKTFLKSRSTLLYVLSVIQIAAIVSIASTMLIPSYSSMPIKVFDGTTHPGHTYLNFSSRPYQKASGSSSLIKIKRIWTNVFGNRTKSNSSEKLSPKNAENTEDILSIQKCLYSYSSLGLKGPINVTFPEEPPTMEEIINLNPDIENGGSYRPSECIPQHRVAVLIPFRNRDVHLRYFLYYMHPFLKKQRLDYKIYIINQYGNGTFNRAKLFNVGFLEAIADYDFQCFTFHDVDLIPEDDRILYTCPSLPRHLSRGVDKFKYKLPYPGIFGGAVQLKIEHFLKVNGFSNTFWGWGGEDDEFCRRLIASRLPKIRYPPEIAKYKMISHKRESGNEPNPERYHKLENSHLKMHTDGLASTIYWVVERTEHALYTNITVELFGPK